MISHRRRAISNNLFVGSIVALFVGAVVVALIVLNLFPSAPTSELSPQGLNLFAGTSSVQSFNISCEGDAILEFSVINPSSNSIPISSVVISGSSLSSNTTVLISLSNGCLTIGQASPTIPPNTNYNFVGYVNTPLRFGATYNCVILLGNGEKINQSLIAQD